MSCPDCTTGGILPGEPTGVTSTGGAYFAPGADNASKRVIIFLTDGFGLPLKNCKLMADQLSKELKCDVWVPDYFAGRPLLALDSLLIPDRAGVKMTIFDWLKFIFFTIPRIPAFCSSRPSVVDSRVREFVVTIREERKYEKVGIVGYCYGGATAIRLGATDICDSVVICHPGGFKLSEARAIKVPAAWACAEDDIFLGKELVLQAEASFAERKGEDGFVNYEFKTYPGTAHGFAARPNLNLPEVKDAYEKALKQTIEWFERTLI